MRERGTGTYHPVKLVVATKIAQSNNTVIKTDAANKKGARVFCRTAQHRPRGSALPSVSPWRERAPGRSGPIKKILFHSVGIGEKKERVPRERAQYVRFTALGNTEPHARAPAGARGASSRVAMFQSGMDCDPIPTDRLDYAIAGAAPALYGADRVDRAVVTTMTTDICNGASRVSPVPFEALPAEVLAHVAYLIACGRDLVAWRIATGAPIDLALRDLAGAHMRRRDAASLFGTGIPLDVWRRALRHQGQSVDVAWVGAAARASRTDIIEWLCQETFGTLVTSTPAAASLVRDSAPLAQCRGRYCGNGAAHAHAPELNSVCAAIYGALDAPIDEAAVFRCLVAQMCRFGLTIDPRAVRNVFVRAMKRRRTDVALNAHDMLTTMLGGACGCVLDPYYSAHMADKGDPVAIHRLSRLGCKGVKPLSKDALEDALREGDGRRVRAIVDLIGALPVGARVIVEAAEAGNVDAVAIAHAMRLYVCDSGIISAAAAKGRLAVVAWAAGALRTPHDGDRPPGRPIAAWHTGSAAYGAVYGNQRDVLDWLLGRPDAVTVVTMGVVRMAVACGRLRMMEDIHALYPRHFDRCRRALDTALFHHDLAPVVKALVDWGARPDSGVYAQALLHGRQHALAYLCGHCDTEGLQDAVDTVAGLALRSTSALVWVQQNMRSVCVAEARAATMAMLGDRDRARLNELAAAVCRCTRCSALS